MKILNVVLSSLLHPHGITTWFRNYLKGLIDNRNENKIVFLTLTSISQKLDWYTEKHENFTHYCVKYNWENLHKVFTTEDFDIIHFHTSIFPSEDEYMDYHIFNFFKNEFKGRLITTIHSLQKMDMSFELYNPMDRIKEFWTDTDMFLQSIYKTDKLVNLSSDVVYISQNDMIWGKKIGTFNKNANNVVIYNGLPTRDGKVKPSYNNKKVGYAHRFVQRKNWYALEEVCKLNPDLEFLFAGDCQGVTALLHKLYKDYENVRYLGKLNAGGIVDLNSEIDIMLCPASYEPFGLTAMESLFFGVAPIVCEGTGTHEVLGDGAFLFDGSNIDLSRAVKEFYEIPYDEIVDRIKKQQEQVSKKSESDLMIKKYFELYEGK